MRNQFEMRDIPQWFISIFALTYITGFLIDSLYYSSIGIGDIGEVFKLRHIQLGLLFLMLFGVVTVPVFFLLFGRRKMAVLGDNPNELPPMNTIMALNTVLYFGTIYYVIAIVPPGYFYFIEHPFRLLSFFALIFSVVVGYICFTGILSHRRRIILKDASLTDDQRRSKISAVNVNNKKLQEIFLYVVFCYIVLWDYLIFRDLIPELLGALYPYGMFFFFFCFLFAAQLFRIVRRLEMDGKRMTGFAKVGFILIASLGLLVLYYTTVAAFAYTIFPYIPSIKGGAEYASANVMSIVVDEHRLIRNTAFVPTEGRLDNLVLLYSTEESLYFGVCVWRKSNQIKTKGPAAILEVKRDEIKYLVINASTPAKSSDCPASQLAATAPLGSLLPESSSPQNGSPSP
jgi:hypothetical protein